MDAPVWQRYVAAACGHAWSLGVHDTEEVLRCVEALLATSAAGSATAQVLLPTGVGELVVERSGDDVRIRIRTHASLDRERHTVDQARPDSRTVAPPQGPTSTPHGDGEATMNRSWQTYVANLCSDAWGLSPLRSRKVVSEIEVLIATDQLSDLSVAGVLARVGVLDTVVGAAARSIRITIGDTSSEALP